MRKTVRTEVSKPSSHQPNIRSDCELESFSFCAYPISVRASMRTDLSSHKSRRVLVLRMIVGAPFPLAGRAGGWVIAAATSQVATPGFKCRLFDVRRQAGTSFYP
jgi:hypothetical protein